ncbi:MAG: TlpA family protein disulfide reductase [Gemmataceae bacterium]
MRLLLLPLTAALCAAAPPATSPGGDALARLRAAYEGRQAALTKQLEKIQADLERLEERRTDDLLALVKKHPADPGVFPALEFLLLDATPHAGLALELITAHHLDHSRLGRLCLFLIEADEGMGSKTEALARGAFHRSPHRDVRALAGLALARLLVARAETTDRAYVRAKSRKEAEAVLTALAGKYDAVPLPAADVDDERVRLGAVVRPMLFDLQRLAAGSVVPELSGPADDGRPMKLSDERGKVVVLVFWSAASGASAELFPRLKALQEAHKGRPFAVVGVADDEVDVPPESRPGWRSFRNGREKGPSVSAAWNLRSWPTLYLIDAKGVIRSRWAGKPDAEVLERQVGELLAK